MGLILSASFPHPACPGMPAWHGNERRQALHKHSMPLRAKPPTVTFPCNETFPRRRASGPALHSTAATHLHARDAAFPRELAKQAIKQRDDGQEWEETHVPKL